MTAGTILLLVLVPLSGCSGSDGSSPGATSSKAATAGGEGGEGVENPSSQPKSGSAKTSTGSSRGGDSTASEAGPALTRKLPQAMKPGSYSFTAGDAGARRRFTRAAGKLKNVYSSVHVYTATSGGVAKADIAVFTFPAATATEPRFQGQIVSQLVSDSTGIRTLRYESLRGRSAAVASGKVSGVGYFRGGKAVVVLSRATKSRQSAAVTAANVAYTYSK